MYNNSIRTSYSQAAELIYSTAFTTSFISWLFGTKRKTALTFARKYHDDTARHEDVTEFIIGKLPALVQNEPELFSVETWATPGHVLQARLFTIYHNYTTDRWRAYKRIKAAESISLEDIQMNNVPAVTPDLVNALAYKKAWNDYTSTLDSQDRIIALYLLDGALTMPQLEQIVGIKKSQIYVRIEKIRAGIEATLNNGGI